MTDAATARPWSATVLTLFPDAFPGPLGVSVINRARQHGVWRLETLDIRTFSNDKHASVDDTPAGGGPGMVMRADVLGAALDGVTDTNRPHIVLSARGAPVTQRRVRELAAGPGVVLVCGRFEGIDQRLIESRGLEEMSVADIVLAGGEVAAIMVLEACVRLLPGVLGSGASTQEESFEEDLLEYPHYTRPRSWEGLEIPEVLLSGDHAKVARWRREQRKLITRERRADLWAHYVARQKSSESET